MESWYDFVKEVRHFIHATMKEGGVEDDNRQRKETWLRNRINMVWRQEKEKPTLEIAEDKARDLTFLLERCVVAEMQESEDWKILAVRLENFQNRFREGKVNDWWWWEDGKVLIDCGSEEGVKLFIEDCEEHLRRGRGQVQKWEPGMNASREEKSPEEWILMIRGVPPHLWSGEIFVEITKKIGSFEEFQEEGELLRDRTCRRIKITNLVDRFPHTILLRWRNLCFSVSLSVEHELMVWKWPATMAETRGGETSAGRGQHEVTGGRYGAVSSRRQDTQNREGGFREPEASRWSDHCTMEKTWRGLDVEEEGNDSQRNRKRAEQNYDNRNEGDRSCSRTIEEGEVEGLGPTRGGGTGRIGPRDEGTDNRVLAQTNMLGPKENDNRPIITYQKKTKRKKK